MFEGLMQDIQHTFAERFLKVQLVFDQPPAPPATRSVAQPTPVKKTFNALGIAEPETTTETVPAEPPPESPRAEPRVVGAGTRSRGATSLSAGAPGAVDYSKVGRNDPCPCGSGKKFKKCHGPCG
jgi:preprotein translocase subunit SecA